MKKVMCSLLAAGLLCTAASAANPITSGPGEVYEPNTGGNIAVDAVYCGDPAVLLDDDGTVYLYAGEDTGDGSYYYMPNYLCYSSTDLINWKYEGIPLRAADFGWGSPSDAWAAQVVKHGGKYYFYNSKNATGISVAVSDSPTGPFTDARDGVKLIEPGWTKGNVSWDDIDPTVWVENDENGIEHRYLCWGNGNVYMAELEPDMVNLTDRSGDGKIDGDDIDEVFIENIPTGYTEAPWIYKRNGLYYLFFASGWREDLSYATSDSIYGPYDYGGLVMDVGASSNTNHPAVLDFNGETYIFYHTGAQEMGGGYLRSVCVGRLIFDENGGVAQIEESSLGLDGQAVKLTIDGRQLWHSHFENSHADAEYPMAGTLKLDGDPRHETDGLWQLVPGKIPGEGHVSIQSVNKMGYFVTDFRGFPRLTHDTEGTVESRTARTFIQTLSGGGFIFESLASPGKYLSLDSHGNIVLSDEPAVFGVETARVPANISAAATDGKITVTAQGTPNIRAVITARGPAAHVGLAATDENGRLTYTFTPSVPGEYTIYCLGRTVKVGFGGESQ